MNISEISTPQALAAKKESSRRLHEQDEKLKRKLVAVNGAEQMARQGLATSIYIEGVGPVVIMGGDMAALNYAYGALRPDLTNTPLDKFKVLNVIITGNPNE